MPISVESAINHCRRLRNVCWMAKAVQITVHIPPHISHSTPIPAPMPSVSGSLAVDMSEMAGMSVPSNEKIASSANP